MLSYMESSRTDLEEARRAMLRAEASPFIDYPRLGAWYPVAWALWTALLVTTVHVDVENPLLQLGIAIAPTLLALAFLGWYSRRHGALPSPHAPRPRVIAALVRRLWVLIAVVAVVTITVDLLAGQPWSAIVGAVLAGSTIAWYEHAYGVVADRIRAELA